MSRTILALALASSVSAYLLPAKVQGRVRGVYAPLASSALLSMRSRPLYMMSIDPDALAQPVSMNLLRWLLRWLRRWPEGRRRRPS